MGNLLDSVSFKKSLEDPADVELSELVNLMSLEGPDDVITSERYHSILRPWNSFNECDWRNAHAVSEKELDLLLWFLLKERPPAEFAKSFLDNHIDLDQNGRISRLEWVQAAVNAK